MPTRFLLLVPCLPFILSAAGCAGGAIDAINAIQSSRAESVAEEKRQEARDQELVRTQECMALLEQKYRDLDAGLAELKALVVEDEEGLQRAEDRWEALKKEIRDVPADCRREVKLRSDPDERAHQKKAFVPRRKAWEALDARLTAEQSLVARALIRKGIKGNAPRRSRTILFPIYNSEVNTRNEELEGLAREIGALYDAQLLAKFKKYGGYGKLNAGGNKVCCVFSAEPWPNDLEGIESRFQTHFVGKGAVVHVLARLPLPAHHYGGRGGSWISVQLISQNYGAVDVGESIQVGKPELLGDTPYVRASFELPPTRFEHTRYFFDARVVLNWIDGGGDARGEVLSQSSFTWQAD